MHQRYNLTTKQREAFEFIKAYIEEHEQSPNYDEIMEGIGLKSKSGVNRLVTGLQERGWIAYLPNQARSITIIEEDQSDEN